MKSSYKIALGIATVIFLTSVTYYLMRGPTGPETVVIAGPDAPGSPADDPSGRQSPEEREGSDPVPTITLDAPTPYHDPSALPPRRPGPGPDAPAPDDTPPSSAPPPDR
ncbi:MAG: hypothetical protein R3336_09840, partial [Phycisphaeraceae bacterium]|nr:hypothetical protein [Phycisphaeraceae bacterium]